MMVETIELKKRIKNPMQGINPVKIKKTKLEINTLTPKFTFKSKNGAQLKPTSKVLF